MRERRAYALLALLAVLLIAQSFLVQAYGLLLGNLPLVAFLVLVLLLNFTHEATSADQPWVDRPGDEP